MLRRMKNIDLIVKTCAQVKADQQVLIVADDHGSSTKIGQQLAETCTAEGAEVVLAIMAPRKYNGQEPPKSIAAAMLECDVVFIVASGGPPIVHTTAAKASREKGIRHIMANALRGEANFEQEISLADLQGIKERSDRIMKIVSASSSARVTSASGTDLKMSLKGRKPLSLHPLSGANVIAFGSSGEVAISPVEGTTEGVLVSDGGFLDWESPPKEPLRLSIKKGRVLDVSGPEDYVKSTKELIYSDENASNCAAELGIGTGHNSPRRSRGGPGTVHIAVGRNNDIGGATFSQIHNDLVIYYPTLWLDNVCLIKDGELKLP